MALSFAINTAKGETFDNAKRKRSLADSIAGNLLSQRSKNVGEGLSGISQALIYRMLMALRIFVDPFIPASSAHHLGPASPRGNIIHLFH